MKDYSEEIKQIQIKLSYLEDFLNNIQEASLEHDAQILRLQKENEILRNKIKEILDPPEEILNRRPPHY